MKKRNPITGLYAVVDTTYVSPGDAGRVAEEILKGGVWVLQLRAKEETAGEVLKAAHEIKAAAAKHGALFILNDRVDVALLADAGGVHLGTEDLPVKEARRLLGKDKVIGFSTHNKREVLEADRLYKAGTIDYISFGPVFPTTTKKDARRPKGLLGLSEARSNTKCPIVAIGGISDRKLQSVLAEGADSVAMISAILSAKDRCATTSSLVKRINNAAPKTAKQKKK